MKPYEHAARPPVRRSSRFTSRSTTGLTSRSGAWPTSDTGRCVTTRSYFRAEQFRPLRAAREGLGELPVTLRNSDGREVSIRDVAEQHVREGLGWIPTVQDWLGGLPPQTLDDPSRAPALTPLGRPTGSSPSRLRSTQRDNWCRFRFRRINSSDTRCSRHRLFRGLLSRFGTQLRKGVPRAADRSGSQE